MRPPEFWTRDGLVPRLLDPLGRAWDAAGAVRFRLARPWTAPVPVVCIGNLVAGGAGKTPVALAVARMLAARGLRPHLLSRGYGGTSVGPLRVDPAAHDAGKVGDEALLLAAAAPAWVARDGVAGARAAVAAGADALVLDDGFQNPALAKTLSLVVVDGEAGFGNGRVMPAGPLRESIARGLARATAIVLVGEDRAGIAARAATLPVLRAELRPRDPARFAGRRIVAFAGIGRPEKFFATLAGCGAELVERRGFPDHHRYTPAELAELRAAAGRHGATLATTAKDHVRLAVAERAGMEVLDVDLAWADPAAAAGLLARFVISPGA